MKNLGFNVSVILMKIFLTVIFLILVIIAVLLFSPLRINAEYRDGKVKLIFRCAFVKFTLDTSKLRKKKKTEKQKQNSAKAEDTVKEADGFSKFDGFKSELAVTGAIIAEAFELVKNRVRFSDIYLRLRYGTGDAAGTGILYGGIWILVGNIYAFLCRYFYVEFPTVELDPVFNEKAFEIEVQGIIKTRLVHIIIAAFRSLKLYMKYNKTKGVV